MPNENLDLISFVPWTLIFTWCNLIILFFIMKKFLFKPVLKVLEQRKNEIDTMYQDATQSRETAQELEKEYSAKMLQAKQQAGEIVKNAQAQAQKRETEIIDAAKEKANAITEKAKAEIEQEKKKAYQEIKGEIADISVSIASKMVEREINAKDHETLISEFIENVGEIK